MAQMLYALVTSDSFLFSLPLAKMLISISSFHIISSWLVSFPPRVVNALGGGSV